MAVSMKTLTARDYSVLSLVHVAGRAVSPDVMNQLSDRGLVREAEGPDAWVLTDRGREAVAEYDVPFDLRSANDFSLRQHLIDLGLALSGIESDLGEKL